MKKRKKILSLLLSVIMVLGLVPCMTQEVHAADMTRHPRFKLMIEGNLNPNVDLKGHKFFIQDSAGTNIGSADSKYSGTYSYVQIMNLKLNPAAASDSQYYKVVLDENDPTYTMGAVSVSFPTTYEASPDTLYLTKKTIPQDNADAAISIADNWTDGDGTEANPKSVTKEVGTNTSSFTITTTHTDAVITYNDTSEKGSMSIKLPYGENQEFAFSVTSPDETKTVYYKAIVTRPKFKPVVSPTEVKPVSPSQKNGSDGMIIGLQADKKYEYKLESADTYISVPKGSTEITGLTAGKYKIRYEETESMQASPDHTVTINEPQPCSITWNLPPNVTMEKAPNSYVTGRPFEVKLRLPKNRIITKVNTTNTRTLDLTIDTTSISYEQQADCTIATLRPNAGFDATDVGISPELSSGEYYAVHYVRDELFETYKHVIDVPHLANEIPSYGGINYYPKGSTISATLEKNDLGYKVSDLAVYKTGTDTPVESKVNIGDKTSSISWTLNEEVDLRYQMEIVPGNYTTLNEIIDQIGSLDQYVDDEARQEVKRLLDQADTYLSAHEGQQTSIDVFVDRLKYGYSQLTRKIDLTDSKDITIFLDKDTYIYDGKPWAPAVTVAYGNTTLEENVDYTVTFPDDMTSPGKKNIAITYIGKYKGSAEISGTIEQYFSVNITVGGHGSAAPQGPLSLLSGSDASVVFTADKGYYIREIRVNGRLLQIGEKTASYTYQIENISENLNISADFVSQDGQTGSKNQSNTTTTQTGSKNKGNAKSPQTGDNNNISLWIALMFLSLAGVGGTVWYSRKKRIVK